MKNFILKSRCFTLEYYTGKILTDPETQNNRKLVIGYDIG